MGTARGRLRQLRNFAIAQPNVLRLETTPENSEPLAARMPSGERASTHQGAVPKGELLEMMELAFTLDDEFADV
jgi:hypothetical protein